MLLNHFSLFLQQSQLKASFAAYIDAMIISLYIEMMMVILSLINLKTAEKT